MSRIGRMPIPLPAEVKIELEDHTITVRGPKGELSRRLSDQISLKVEDGRILVERPSDGRIHRSLHGLTRTLVANMVEGVTKGFMKALDIHGVGFRVTPQGDRLTLQIGYSHPVEVIPPPGIKLGSQTFTPTADNNYLCARVTVEGIDKELVGQFAAKIRQRRKPEPYKGKGIRYQGELIRRKAGKATKTTGGRKK